MSEQDVLDNYAAPGLISGLLRKLATTVDRPLRLMEVCGTHTTAIFESGLRAQLAGMGVKLLSGPGCPVCVTAQADIDYVLHIAADPQTVLCTFGDMLSVPGTAGSLAGMKAQGADVRVVYSPLDALDLALKHTDRRVVFLAIGFETDRKSVV